MDGLSQQDLPPLTESKGTALIMSLCFLKILAQRLNLFDERVFANDNEFLYTNGLLMFICLYVMSNLKIRK